MRLLWLIDSLDPPGGAEQAIAAMAPRYVRSGLEVGVGYLEEMPGLQQHLRSSGVSVFPLDGRGGRLGWLARTARLVGAYSPDLVHTTLFEADLVGRTAAWARRTPVVSSLVNVPYGPEHLSDPTLRRSRVRAAWALDAATCHLARRFHANSSHVADVMAPRMRIHRNLIDVIPRGKDPEVIGRRTAERRAAARLRFGIAQDAPVLVAIGRHEHQKGYDVLIDAMPIVARTHPDVRLLVAGPEGNETAQMRSRILQRGVERNVELLGARRDAPDLLVAADVAVLASRREGFSNVLLEALALETPIVATQIGPFVEALHDVDVAELVPAGQPGALGSAVLLTLLSSERNAARTARGRALFEQRYTLDVVVDQMLGFYDRALGTRTHDSRESLAS